jgi:hypothetical protein
VACGEASSSVSTSGTTTSSSVASVSSAYANVTSLTLTAASNLLTQVMGSQRTVTITGALNANTNPNLQLEWFVNGVKQSQTGRLLDFTPVTAGSYVVTARVGNIVSNNLTISVGNPTIAVTGAMFVNSRLIEVTGQAGATVTLVGATLSDNAYYSLAKGKYVLELDEAVDQGTQVTVRLERAGFTPSVQTVTFDTRVLRVNEVTIGSDDLLPVNGVFQVVRPFDAGLTYNKNVNVDLEQTNLIPVSGTVNQVVEITNPAGVKTVSTNAIDTLQDFPISVTSTTALGLWNFKIGVGDKSVEFKVEILEAKPEILLNPKAYSFNDPITGLAVNYDVQLTRDLNAVRAASPADNNFATIITTNTISGNDEFRLPVTTDSTGAYVVERPFSTFKNVLANATGTLHYFEFNVMARNFAEPELLDNQLSVTLEGPTSFSTASQTLFGFELEDTTYPGNQVYLISQSNFDTLNNAATGGANATSAYHTVRQVIDRGTPTGDYKFTVKAGELGKEVTKVINVKIVDPTPKLDFVLESYTTLNSQTRIHEVKQVSENVFEIQKPLSETMNYNLSWYTVVKNLQSAVSKDFELIANDGLKELEDRVLFDSTSGLKYDNASAQNTIYVPAGSTAFDLGVVKLKNGATNPLTGYSVTVDITNNNSRLTSTAAQTVTQAVAINTEFEVDLKEATALANALHEDRIVITITPAGTTPSVELLSLGGAAAAGTQTINVAVANLNDVVSFGGKVFADANAFASQSFNLLNMSLEVNGPSDIIPAITQFRAAVLLADNKDTFVLVNQSGSQVTVASDQAPLRLALEDKFLLVDETLPVPGDAFTGGGLNRPVLAVNKATATGSYNLKFTVGDVSKTVTLIVKNPEPKIFVLSAIDAGPAPVIGKGAAGSKFSTTPDLSVETPTYNLLKIYNETGNSTHTVDAADKFVAEANGSYSFFLPDRTLTADDILKAEIAIADLPLGEYNYSISKKYPDGRVVTFADKATVTSLDVHNLAEFATSGGTFAAQNTIFVANWKIDETTYAEGTYEYEFSIGNISRKFVVNVLPQPGLDINALMIGNTTLSLFEKDYLVLAANALGEVKISFDLEGLTGNNYFRIKQEATGFNYTESFVDGGTNGFSNVIYSLKDLQELVLGFIPSTGGDVPAAADDLVITLRFYEKVAKPFPANLASPTALEADWHDTKDAYDIVGVDQVITIKVRVRYA